MTDVKILHPSGIPVREMSGYEAGGNGFGGQLREWQPSLVSEDAALLPNLDLANARSDDLVRNHGYASGGLRLHLDNIVGHIFKLNWKPSWRKLGWTEEQFITIKAEVEGAWFEFAEDDKCYIDAERKRTFTQLVRAAVVQHFNTGDMMCAGEWITRKGCNYSTSIKMISPKRVRTPDGENVFGDGSVKGGIKIGKHGQALGYFVTDSKTLLPITLGMEKFTFVKKETWWGRDKFIHVFDARDDGQTRGKNALMSVMSQMHMLDKLQQTKLQNAIVNAMYAATIESELGSDAAMELIAGADAAQQNVSAWMGYLSQYYGSANVRMNGVKIPHLMAGDKLNLQTPANSDNGYSQLEMSLLQYMAAGIGVSVEQLTRNFQNSNYSSARAALNESWRYFMGERKFGASRFASAIFNLWLEEAIAKGVIKLPSGVNFWQSRSALCRSDWIGTGRMAIDGVKEVKESILLIEAGLSTYEKELAKLGEDYVEIFEQQAREIKIRETKGLSTPSYAKAEEFAPDEPQPTNNKGAVSE